MEGNYCVTHMWGVEFCYSATQACRKARRMLKKSGATVTIEKWTSDMWSLVAILLPEVKGIRSHN